MSCCALPSTTPLALPAFLHVLTPLSLGSTLALRKRADAAAYRMNAELVAALRQATAALLPASAAWANSAEARSIKTHLRPVRTRIAHAPIAA